MNIFDELKAAEREADKIIDLRAAARADSWEECDECETTSHEQDGIEEDFSQLWMDR